MPAEEGDLMPPVLNVLAGNWTDVESVGTRNGSHLYGFEMTNGGYGTQKPLVINR